MVGFGTAFFNNLSNKSTIDELRVEGYRDTTGNGTNDSWVTEHKDAFTIDGNGHAADDPAHDAAGNMTYDGTCRYTYDAWNRLVKVEKAYRDPSGGSVTAGSVQAEMRYDGMGRRVVKAVTNSGDLDCTYHFYYNGQQTVETRNGSDQVVKQYVWGLDYIDELVQTALNGDPVDDPDFDPADMDHDPTYLFALHDANYNVLGVVDDTGLLVERYECEPYGRRTVYFSPGDNDPGLHAPTPRPPCHRLPERAARHAAPPPARPVDHRAAVHRPGDARQHRDPTPAPPGGDARQRHGLLQGPAAAAAATVHATDAAPRRGVDPRQRRRLPVARPPRVARRRHGFLHARRTRAASALRPAGRAAERLRFGDPNREKMRLGTPSRSPRCWC